MCKRVFVQKTNLHIIENAARSFCQVVFSATNVQLEILPLEKFSVEKDSFVFATFDAILNNPCKNCDQIKEDGFFITKKDNVIYVLAKNERGVYYGVHHLLEQNLLVIFSRGAEEEAVQYLPSEYPSWENSEFIVNPAFKVRSFNLCGVGSEGRGHIDNGTAEFLAKNKMNAAFHEIDKSWRNIGLFNNGKRIKNLQVIDDLMETNPKHFMTDAEGNPKKAFGGYESFPNYYNFETAKLYAKRLVDGIEGVEDITHWTMPDNSCFYVLDGDKRLHELPFTSDCGKTVYPTDKNYKSTVYFNFLNRVIKEANKLRPNTYLQVFAYIYSEPAPEIELDEHLIIMVAPIFTNEQTSYPQGNGGNKEIKENLAKWAKKTKRLNVYTYWQSFSSTTYSRPILKVVKENLNFFKKLNVEGVTVESLVDCSIEKAKTPSQQSSVKAYDLNEAFIWAITKLIYNPELEIEKLLDRYCKIVYKESAKEVKEYFTLLQKGYESTPANVWYNTGGDVYYLQFIIRAGLKDKIIAALNKAESKAKTSSVIRKINSIKQTVFKEIEKYDNFISEEGVATRICGELLSKSALDYQNNPSSPWNNVKPLTVLRNSRNMDFYPKEANFSLRIAYDEQNMYFGYTVFDDGLKEKRVAADNVIRYYREDGSEVISLAETYVGGDVINQSVFYGYISGFMEAGRNEQGEFYLNDGQIKSIAIPDGVKTVKYAHFDDNPQKRYVFHVQIIPFKALGESVETAKPYGSFTYVSKKYGTAGWQGYGLWSKQNFKEFKLK